MTSRSLTVVLFLGCGCNSLYLLDGGSAGTSIDTGTSTGIGSSTGADTLTTTTGPTEATTGDSTTWMVVSISSTSETSTSTGETSTSTGETSTATGMYDTGDEPGTTGGNEQARLIFLSSHMFNGAMWNLWVEDKGPGLEGADKQCQSLAGEKGHQGIFRAWLSKGSENAKMRTRGIGMFAELPIRGTGGQNVAPNWDVFSSKILNVPITWTQEGDLSPGADLSFWSGTKYNGETFNDMHTCGGWADFLFENGGVAGNFKDDDNWSAWKVLSCDSYHRLLCIQTAP